jgi:hypothetical protein
MDNKDFKSVLLSIQRSSVLCALIDLDDGTIPHNFQEPDDWQLVVNGIAYPIRAVIAFAARHCPWRVRLGTIKAGRFKRTIDFDSDRDKKSRACLRGLGFIPNRFSDGSTDE